LNEEFADNDLRFVREAISPIKTKSANS